MLAIVVTIVQECYFKAYCIVYALYLDVALVLFS
jgi:hypothetical protein